MGSMSGSARREADSLDNPIWHALTGPHRDLGAVTGPVRRYLPEYAPFVALEDPSPASMGALLEAIRPAEGAVMFTDQAVAVPGGIEIVMAGLLPQMVARRPMPAPVDTSLVVLGAPDVPEMLALVELTQPGPFARRTVEMGRYLGIRVDGQLAAMAGERLRLEGYTEVSAVCTHPAHRRQGHAARLVAAVSSGIMARGDTPFLHVRPDNAAAIATYEALGFETRRAIHLTVLQRLPARG
jgi:ribosomal protein S18 acetylase RimI-like enzyme